MNTSLRVFFSIAVSAWSACGAPIFAAVVNLPDAEMKAYMEKQHVLPIKSKPQAILQSAYEAQWLKWFKFAVMDPFMARISKDGEVQQRAEHLLKNGIMLMRKSPQRDLSYTSEKMTEECEALVKSGIDDPVIYWFQSWAIHDGTRDFEACEKLFQKAYEHQKMVGIRPVLRELMLSKFKSLVEETNLNSKYEKKDEDIVDAVRLSLNDGTYLSEHEEVLVDNLNDIFRRELMKAHLKKVEEICRLPNLSEWVRLMLDGRYHNEKGWIARGGDFADKVPDEAWATFNKEREAAATAFKSALKLHPERGEAAYELLNMAMTGGDTGKKGSEWLDVALDARFDWVHNYRAVLNGLRPRWGGSIEAMLAFGFACVETHRFDTEVPYYFFEAIKYVSRDVDDWHTVFRDPLVAKVAIALCKQRVLDAPTPKLKSDAFALLGAYAWLCGDYMTSAQAFEQVPDGFSRDVKLQLKPYYGWQESVMRGESAIFSKGMGAFWTTTERQLHERKYDEAEKGCEAVRSKVNGAGARLVAERLAVIKFERELAKGGWTPLAVDPSLAGWQVNQGDWEGTSDGSLINHGSGTSAIIYHQGRVGAEFQIRGEFTADDASLGVIFGYGTDIHAEQWITCLQNRSRAYILRRFNSSSIKDEPIRENRVPSSFLITCHEKKITYAINGRNVFTQAEFAQAAEAKNAFKFIDDGRVGFCHYFFGKDKVTRIGKTEVRVLPAGFKPEAPPIIPPPGDMETMRLFKSEKPWVGKIEITTGYYKPEQKIVIGVVDKSDPKKSEAASVVSQVDTQLDSADIFIKKGTWSADGTLFKRSKLTMELGGEFRAKDSLFEECELHKGGGYFVKFFSTKWSFDNCVFSRTFIKPWKLVDIGVKVTNCTFYDVDFSGIIFREDAGKEALDEWVTLKNCRFVRCKVPESVALVSRDSVFESCKFRADEKALPVKTPIGTTIYANDSAAMASGEPDKMIEVKDVKSLGHPVGSSVSHQYENDRLRFK